MKGDKKMGVEREVTERDRWRGGMWEGTDWWMNVCALPQRSKCQFITPSKCFKLKWCLERGWRGFCSDSKRPLLFPTSSASEKHQNKLDKLFNHYRRVITLMSPEHCALRRIRITALSYKQNSIWQQQNYSSWTATSCILQVFRATEVCREEQPHQPFVVWCIIYDWTELK